MPPLKTYHLFLSHAWKYNSDYNRLENLLKNASLFTWKNYSVPEHDPLIDPKTPGGFRKLHSMIQQQIRPVNCFLLLGGMYAAYSNWISHEIDLAKRYNKPIIAIYPYGSERMPLRVQEAADEIVGWRTTSIVDAVRKHAL
jgi:hypothetical protein